jgi:hypothetical protein
LDWGLRVKAEPLGRDEWKAVRHAYYRPTHHVDFWSQPPIPPGLDPSKVGYRRDSYKVSGASDVYEVIAWAEQQKDGRTFVVWLATGGPDPSILRAYGDDPTNPRGLLT